MLSRAECWVHQATGVTVAPNEPTANSASERTESEQRVNMSGTQWACIWWRPVNLPKATSESSLNGPYWTGVYNWLLAALIVTCGQTASRRQAHKLKGEQISLMCNVNDEHISSILTASNSCAPLCIHRASGSSSNIALWLWRPKNQCMNSVLNF